MSCTAKCSGVFSRKCSVSVPVFLTVTFFVVPSAVSPTGSIPKSRTPAPSSVITSTLKTCSSVPEGFSCSFSSGMLSSPSSCAGGIPSTDSLPASPFSSSDGSNGVRISFSFKVSSASSYVSSGTSVSSCAGGMPSTDSLPASSGISSWGVSCTGCSASSWEGSSGRTSVS